MITDAEILFRLVLAAVLGGLVGLEREVHGRPAGIRTYLLLSLGTALLMVLSEYLFFKYEGKLLTGITLSVDPGRIAAQAITGVGFLGAGVIIRYKDTIRGLTTAACVWVVCAVGLGVGAGFYLFSSVTTALVLTALVLLKRFERKLAKDWYKEMEVVTEDTPGQLDRIQEIIDKYHYRVISLGLRKNLQKHELTASYLLRHRTASPKQQVFKEVFELPGVKRVDLEYKS